MIFNSFIFVFAFLPAALAGWWLLRGHHLRLWFLTLMSYGFYGWWNYRFIPLMFLATSADYLAARRIDASKTRRAKIAWLVGLLSFNLGILAVFKYSGFFARTWNQITAPVGAPPLPVVSLILPIGISFYTFNSISYTIDVFRGRIKPSSRFIEFAAFVAMFPHLIAGPIVRFADMADQFHSLRRSPRADEVSTGLWMFVLGMAKKVLVADVISQAFVTPLFASAGSLALVGSWTAVLAYTLQIYFDFSGYSDMAVGLALFLGIRFPQNFDSPYKAANPSEFWRRWHMSLSFWIRDYVFVPMGGSRGSAARTAGVLLLTMALGGLWHGAAWTFVLWGVYHGLLLAIHAVSRRRGWVPSSHTVSVAMMFGCTMIGWVFFRARSVTEAVKILAGMAGMRGVEASFGAFVQPAALMLPVALAIVWFAPNTWQFRGPRSLAAGIALAVLFGACVVRFGSASPFIYYQF